MFSPLLRDLLVRRTAFCLEIGDDASEPLLSCRGCGPPARRASDERSPGLGDTIEMSRVMRGRCGSLRSSSTDHLWFRQKKKKVKGTLTGSQTFFFFASNFVLFFSKPKKEKTEEARPLGVIDCPVPCFLHLFAPAVWDASAADQQARSSRFLARIKATSRHFFSGLQPLT